MDNLDKYYFNRWSQKLSWTDIGPTKKLRLKRLLMYIEKYFPNPEKITLIDYGCGSGWLFYYLNEFGIKNMYGWDVVPGVLQEIKGKYPWVKNLYSSSIGKFSDVPAGVQFDLITSIEVVEHVPNQGKIDYLTSINKILKSEGFFYLTTPNGKFEKTGMENYNQQPVEDWTRPREMKKILKRSDFKIIDSGSIYFKQNLSKTHKLLMHRLVLRLFYITKLERIYLRILDKTMCGLSTYFWCRKISNNEYVNN